MALKGLKELVEKIRKESGLTEEQVEEELNKILPTDWVPKATFNEQSEKLKTVTKAGEDSAKLLKDLQEKANLSDEYKQKIADVKAEKDRSETEYKTQIKTMRLNSAVEKALAGAKAKNAAQAAKLLDSGKIILNDDGTVTGLDEQVKALKKDSAYLFEEDKQTNEPPQKPTPAFNMGGGQPGGAGGNGGNADSALYSAFGIAPPATK